MPRAKRVKRTSPVPEPSSPPPAAAPSSTSSKADSLSPPPSDSIDPALLDEEEEEEAAEQPEPSQQPAEKQKQPFTGGGRGFNALKSFHGQIYTGMAVGGSHTWNYNPGIWKETKEEPDLWRVEYDATKRRARNAPRGSGAPVGTEYHWFIVGHQLAHKNAGSNAWSVPTVKGQREREVELLEDAKRRVQRLPPVHAGEKVRVEKAEKGQRKLDSMFKSKTAEEEPGKREREDPEGDE
ncbi:hypothetical protein CIRG_05153 [Coccidioides immitis RMSCC 2394]|uniref:Uncharacterized protein n=1 Tax=Coccidioides immitis RMSCC 2394 TaxID=404692 RepID=A0A0J7B6A8_COCIT|nr:hypothetical protein CIRG_05153 [Coccidioides immitis RMSCC 2394]